MTTPQARWLAIAGVLVVAGILLVVWWSRGGDSEQSATLPDAAPGHDFRLPRFVGADSAIPTDTTTPSDGDPAPLPAQPRPPATYPVSLRAPRRAIQKLGGDLYQTVVMEQREYHLSYAGEIRRCAEQYLNRSGLATWTSEGSLRLDAEVIDDRVYFRGAEPLSGPSPDSTPDAAFWSCYTKAVTKVGFVCHGCTPGRHVLPWRLKPVVYERGKPPAPAVVVPDPDQDSVLFLRH
jgi:hypothetical protein